MNDIDYENAIGLRNFIYDTIENLDPQDENMKSKLRSLELQLIYYIPELFKTHKSLDSLVNLKKAMTKINLQTETGAYRERFGNDEGSLKFLKNYKKFMEIMEYRGIEQSINPRSKTASQEQVSTLQAKIRTYEDRILGIENQLQRAGLATPKEIEKSIDFLILSHQQLIRAQEELNAINLDILNVLVLSPRAQATREAVRKVYQRKNELEKQLVELEKKQQQEKDALIRESRERERQAIEKEIQRVQEQARLELATASAEYEARIQQLENSISADQQNLSRMQQLEELVTNAAMQANLRSPLTSIEYFQALQRQYELRNNLANSQRGQILKLIDELNIKKNELESKEKELVESRNIRGQQAKQIQRLKKQLEESKQQLDEKIRELEEEKLKTTSDETMALLNQEIEKNKELQAQVSQLQEQVITLKQQADSAIKQSLKQTELFNTQYDQLQKYEQRYERFKSMSDDNLSLAADYFADKERLENKIKSITNEANERIQKLNSKIQLGNQNNTSLRDQIETIRNKSQEDIAELRNQINNANQTIDGLDQDNALLNQQLEEKNKVITAANNRIRKLEEDLQAEQNRVFQNEERIQELERQITDERANLATSQNDLQTANDTIQTINLQLGELDRANQELRAQIAAQPAPTPVVPPAAPTPVVPPAAPAPVVPAAAPAAVGGRRRVRAGGAPPAAGPGAAVVAPAPNIFPGDNMATQSRGLDTTTVSQIDEFLSDLEVAINSAIANNRALNFELQPLMDWNRNFGITNWETAQAWLKKKGMVDLGDITENPKQFKIFMDGQAKRANVRTGLGNQLYTIKVLPLRFQPLTSEYKQGPVVKTIANLPGKERTVTSDLGTIVIPGQSNYALRRQGLNYVVTSAGKSQSFASERDANYFIQTGGFGRKTYGPITERVFGTPTKNISQAIY